MTKKFLKISGKAPSVAAHFRLPKTLYRGLEEPSKVLKGDLLRHKFYDKNRRFSEYCEEALRAVDDTYMQGQLAGSALPGKAKTQWITEIARHHGFMFRPLTKSTKVEASTIYVAPHEGALQYKLLDKNNHVCEGKLNLKKPITSVESIKSDTSAWIIQELIKSGHLSSFPPENCSISLSFDLSYYDVHNQLRGLSINYYPYYPKHWYITLSKNSIAPFTANNIVSYGHPDLLKPLNLDEEYEIDQDVEPADIASIAMDALFADLSIEINAPDVSDLLKSLFTETGDIQKNELIKFIQRLPQGHNIEYDKPNKVALINEFLEQLKALRKLLPTPRKALLVEETLQYLAAFNVDEEFEFYKVQGLAPEKYQKYPGECTLAHLEQKYETFKNEIAQLKSIQQIIGSLSNSRLMEEITKSQNQVNLEFYLTEIAERLKNKAITIDKGHTLYNHLNAWLYNEEDYKDLALERFSDEQTRTFELLEYFSATKKNLRPLFESCLLSGKVTNIYSKVFKDKTNYGLNDKEVSELYYRSLSTKDLLLHANYAIQKTKSTGNDDTKHYKNRLIHEIVARLLRQAKHKTDIEAYLYNVENPEIDQRLSRELFGNSKSTHQFFSLQKAIQTEVNTCLKHQCRKIEEAAKGIITLPKDFENNKGSWKTSSDDEQDEKLNLLAPDDRNEEPRSRMTLYRNALQAVLSDSNLTNPETLPLNTSAIFCSVVLTLVCLVCPPVLIGCAVLAGVSYWKTGYLDFLHTTDSQQVTFRLSQVSKKLGLFLPLIPASETGFSQDKDSDSSNASEPNSDSISLY